jgi:hypothetical protein
VLCTPTGQAQHQRAHIGRGAEEETDWQTDYGQIKETMISRTTSGIALDVAELFKFDSGVGVGVGVAAAPGNGMSPARVDMDRQRTSREIAISLLMV